MQAVVEIGDVLFVMQANNGMSAFIDEDTLDVVFLGAEPLRSVLETILNLEGPKTVFFYLTRRRKITHILHWGKSCPYRWLNIEQRMPAKTMAVYNKEAREAADALLLRGASSMSGEGWA